MDGNGEKKPAMNVKELLVSLPGKELRLYLARDFEALITDLEDADKVPCWAEVWPAAYGLARYLWEQTPFSPGEEVVELGAGMGLPGIVCALKGARLTLSDFNPQALEMAAVNARANGVEPALLLADWRSFPRGQKFAGILASDILYDPQLNPYLGRIFHEILLPGGRLLISHPQRPVTREFIQDWYNPDLFTAELFHETVVLQESLLPSYAISIHLFTRRAAS